MISNLGVVLRNIYSKKSLNNYKARSSRSLPSPSLFPTCFAIHQCSTSTESICSDSSPSSRCSTARPPPSSWRAPCGRGRGRPRRTKWARRPSTRCCSSAGSFTISTTRCAPTDILFLSCLTLTSALFCPPRRPCSSAVLHGARPRHQPRHLQRRQHNEARRSRCLGRHVLQGTLFVSRLFSKEETFPKLARPELPLSHAAATHSPCRIR